MVAMLYLIAPTTLSDVHAPLAFNDVQLVGSARLSVLFWDVYDVQLFTNTGRYDPDQPFLLSIRYLREVTGEDIAERSIAEMKANDAIEASSLAQWTEQLQKEFSNPSLTQLVEPKKYLVTLVFLTLLLVIKTTGTNLH